MAITIQTRRDTAANWTSADPTLASGEIGLESDTNKVKFGDGTTAWTSLGYFGGVGSGTVTSVDMSVPTGFALAGNPITSNGTLAVTFDTGYSLPTDADQTDWDTAFTQTRQWDGGSTGLVAATGRASLGATTVGGNLYTLTNPSAVTYLRVNADNSVDTLSATDMINAILPSQSGESGNFLTTDGSDVSWGAGGAGAVDSVNTQTGVVVLDTDDISDSGATNKYTTAADISKLSGIEASADVTDEANVVSALDGATLTDVGTPAASDKILLQDASDSDALKYASFSEFGGGGSLEVEDEGSSVETGVTKLNFIGSGVTASSSTANEVDITIAGGGAPVDSVNGETGTVVLDADDISDTSTTNKFTTAADISKLSGIEALAEVNPTNSEIKVAYEANADTNAFTDAEKTLLSNQSGTNTGDQDISGISTNASAISALDTDKQDILAEGAFVDGDKTKLDSIETNADVTDETNVVNALNGATLTDIGTPASTDKILIQDTSDSDNLKYVDFSEFSAGGDLLAANNLSDLDNSDTALVNLGLTATATELNYVDGVTSAIQTQLDAKEDADADIAKYDDATANFANTLQQGGNDVLDSSDLGTSVQAYDANTAKTDEVQSFTAGQSGGITALTDGATITPDMSDGNFFSVTLEGNRTLANPSNLVVGQSGCIFISQDATGSRTLAYGSNWDFAGGTAPVLSTSASAVDRLDYVVRTTSSIHAVLSKDWS